jgi:hypothetical protein
MIIAEKERSLNFDTKGQTGTLVFQCDWDDIEPLPRDFLPRSGDPWITAAGQPYPQLRCVSASGERLAGHPGIGVWTAQFSTAGEITEDYFEVSTDYGLEAGPDITGWIYEDTETPVVDIEAPPVSVATITVKVRRESPGHDALMKTINRVNDRTFLGFDEKHLLCTGANVDNTYDISNGDMISSAVTYKFSVRDRAYNLFWRPPLQARDENWNLIFWHNISDEEPFYTEDMKKVGTPVWISDVPGMELNPAGKGGWTAIVDDDGNDYYEAVDMSFLLGISG